MALNRKYQSYYEYTREVVDKCSHSYLMLDHYKFRNYKIQKCDGANIPLPGGKLVKIVPARCKSYSCPVCGRKKVYDLMDRLKRVDLRGYRFFTLTLKNDYSLEDTEANLLRVSKCFTKLNNRLRKIERFKNLEYFKVIEVGQNGNVHIHGLWNKYIDIKLLSTMWFAITRDSYRADVKRIQNKKDVVNYLFKYLTKTCLASYAEHDPALFEMDLINTAKLFYENGKRRYSSSKNFFAKVEKRNSDWLPYGFESNDSENIEKEINFLIREYNLKPGNFDLTQYDESDLYLQNLFDTS